MSTEHECRERLIKSFARLLLSGIVAILAVLAGTFVFTDSERIVVVTFIACALAWSGYKLTNALKE